MASEGTTGAASNIRLWSIHAGGVTFSVAQDLYHEGPSHRLDLLLEFRQVPDRLTVDPGDHIAFTAMDVDDTIQLLARQRNRNRIVVIGTLVLVSVGFGVATTLMYLNP